MATTVSAAWTFRSAATDDGKVFSFPAYVERQGIGARIATFTVDVSYDDGRSRVPAAVRVDGDTVRQTVTRAYQID